MSGSPKRSSSFSIPATPPPTALIFYVVVVSVLLLVPYNYPDLGRYAIEKYDDYGQVFFSTSSGFALDKRSRSTSTMFSHNHNYDPKAIRKWGCNRMETPTIFVHLAKAGGGSNRARFAAAALGYNRSEWHKPAQDVHHYVVDAPLDYGEAQSSTRHAKFCNSNNQNYVVPFRDSNGTLQTYKTFEGSLPCNASTPLGLAVGCPKPLQRQCMGCHLSGETCDTVYVGHNFMGSELHWLPPKYLKKWWNQNWVPNSDNYDGRDLIGLEHDIEETWKRLGSSGNDAVWCEEGYNVQVFSGENLVKQVRHGRVRSTNDILQHRQGDGSYFEKCSTPIAAQADGQFQEFWERSSSMNPHDYSSIYASMPLHRTTVMRDPWSWIGSKFFWHHYDTRGFKCDKDLDTWMYRLVQAYLLPFCGVDCDNRFRLGIMSYEEIAAQAESNLRQSFSVVGLLNETDQFYEMVSTRIGYLDMTRNPHVEGKLHKSGGEDKDEAARCKALFKTSEFQEEAKRQVPEMKLVEDLYNVGVEVNKFQKEELSQCGR